MPWLPSALCTAVWSTLHTTPQSNRLKLNNYYDAICHSTVLVQSSTLRVATGEQWRLYLAYLRRFPRLDKKLSYRRERAPAHTGRPTYSTYIGWLTDRAMHRTPQAQHIAEVVLFFDTQTLRFKKCWPKTHIRIGLYVLYFRKLDSLGYILPQI